MFQENDKNQWERSQEADGHEVANWQLHLHVITNITVNRIAINRHHLVFIIISDFCCPSVSPLVFTWKEPVHRDVNTETRWWQGLILQ